MQVRDDGSVQIETVDVIWSGDRDKAAFLLPPKICNLHVQRVLSCKSKMENQNSRARARCYCAAKEPHRPSWRPDSRWRYF